MESSRSGVADRAKWLAELAQAIEEAQQLAWRLGFVEARSSEALELYVRLEAARIEVEALRGIARPLPLHIGGPLSCFPEGP